MNQEFPSVQDIDPSWSDVAFTFTITGGAILQTSDIAGVKWSRSVEVGERVGTSGGRVMGRTTGSGKQEASATLYRSGMRKLVRALMSTAPQRGNQRLISLVAFDLLVQHTPPGAADIYTTKIKGCRYLGDSDDMKEGNDADKIEITLNPIEIANIVDGLEVVLL